MRMRSTNRMRTARRDFSNGSGAGGPVYHTFERTVESSGNWTSPADLIGSVTVSLTGSSGFGAGGDVITGGGGGGGGAFSQSILALLPSTAYPYVVPSAGSGARTTFAASSPDEVTAIAGGNAAGAAGGAGGLATAGVGDLKTNGGSADAGQALGPGGGGGSAGTAAVDGADAVGPVGGTPGGGDGGSFPDGSGGNGLTPGSGPGGGAAAISGSGNPKVGKLLIQYYATT